jgi:hypothetical protein
VEDQTRIPGADDLSGSRCFPGRDGSSHRFGQRADQREQHGGLGRAAAAGSRLPDSQGLDGLLRFRADFSRAKVVIVFSQDTPKPTAVNLRKIGTALQTTELLWREVQL